MIIATKSTKAKALAHGDFSSFCAAAPSPAPSNVLLGAGLLIHDLGGTYLVDSRVAIEVCNDLAEQSEAELLNFFNPAKK